jgi:hypothetical protein
LIPKTKKMFFRAFPAYAGYNGFVYHHIWGKLLLGIYIKVFTLLLFNTI